MDYIKMIEEEQMKKISRFFALVIQYVFMYVLLKEPGNVFSLRRCCY